MEYKIPGFSKYTIDDELVVRSYSSIAGPRIMSNHGRYGSVRLMPDGGHRCDKKDMSVHKIFFCAKAGINPAMFNARKQQIYIHDGEILTKNEYFDKVKRKNWTYITPPCEDKERLDRLDRDIETLQIIKKSLISGDWGELVEIIYGFEHDITCYLMGRFEIQKNDAEFCFKLACDDILRRITELGYNYYNLRAKMYSLSRSKYYDRKNAHVSMKDFYERVAVKKQLLDL